MEPSNYRNKNGLNYGNYCSICTLTSDLTRRTCFLDSDVPLEPRSRRTRTLPLTFHPNTTTRQEKEVNPPSTIKILHVVFVWVAETPVAGLDDTGCVGVTVPTPPTGVLPNCTENGLWFSGERGVREEGHSSYTKSHTLVGQKSHHVSVSLPRTPRKVGVRGKSCRR